MAKDNNAGKVSKTNVSARKGRSDMRPKSELQITGYTKPNGAMGHRRVWVPINREPVTA